jgi:hypothetical protein
MISLKQTEQQAHVELTVSARLPLGKVGKRCILNRRKSRRPQAVAAT